MIGYDNIKLKCPYTIKTLLNMKITQKINDHGKIYVTGIVPEETKDDYIKMASSKDKIQVSSSEGILFKGSVLNIKIRAVGGIYYIEIEGITNTYDLDIKLKCKSFQDKDMPYTGLISKAIEDYKGDYIDTITKGRKLTNLIVQYYETDWQFLRRMASHFQSVLVPDVTSDKPKLWFGMPDGRNAGNIEDYHYSIKRDLSEFMKANESEELSEEDFTYYEIESEKVLNIGDKINVKGNELIITQYNAVVEDGLLKYEYILSSKKGARANRFYNQDIIGASIEGKVIDIQKDKIKIHLEIDKEQSVSTAKWFTYQTSYSVEGQCGWYVMPKLKDSVKLYFTNEMEDNAVAMTSTRKEGNTNQKNQDPKIKYLQTQNNKEMKLAPKKLVFTSKNGISINLNEDKGIEIKSSEPINFKAAKDLKIEADGKINIKAKENIYLICNSTSILMDGMTYLRGKDVKVEGTQKIPVSI